MSRPIDPNVVIDRVAEWFHIAPAEMTGDGRAMHLAHGRSVAAAILHEHSGRGWPSVASLLGRVNHGGSAGIMNQAKKVSPIELEAITEFVREGLS